MAADRIRLTEAEFAVLEPLWQFGPQTIRQLTARLYPSETVSDYATVQKLLDSLETSAPAKNREVEAQKAKARSVKRFGPRNHPTRAQESR